VETGVSNISMQEGACYGDIQLLLLQADPTDAVFFIEDGNCQVGYNQRRTADEDLISTVSLPCCPPLAPATSTDLSTR